MTNNQTDWQELCAQLFEALRAHGTTWSDDVLLDRVWVALRAAESKHKRKQPTQAEPEPEQLPQGYVDPEHKDQERKLLEVFYRACRSEGGTADEIHLRGIKAVLATDVNPRNLLTEHEALLARLSDVLWNNGLNKAAREADAAVERLHNFLAQPKPQGPTDEEIADEARKYLVNEYTLPAEITYFLDSDNFEYEPTIGCFRAVLARWGK